VLTLRPQSTLDPSLMKRAPLDRLLLALCLAAPALSAQALPGNLVDVTDDPLAPDWCGISFQYAMNGDSFTESGGAACGDFDNDGKVDVFLPGNRNQRSALYRNLGNGQFVDVGMTYGVGDAPTASSTGVFADYDNDGDLDLIVVAHAGDNLLELDPHPRLFRNMGAAGGYHFQNVSTQAAFAFASTVWPTSTGWQGGMAVGDYDRDGYLDVFATWWWSDSNENMWRLFKSVPNPVPGDPSDPTYSPRIFVDATIESGLDFPFAGEPWQPEFMDVDRDGWPDLHVCVDFDYDFMFRNNHDGTFTDECTRLGLNGVPPEQRNEMGSAVGDIDNDGDLDVHVTNLFEADRLYRADSVPGGVSFVDVAPQTGLSDSPWGWGDVFFDFDNDGDLDHATASGFKLPTVLPWFNMLHINLYPQTLPDGVTVAWQNASLQVPEFSKMLTPQGDDARGIAPLDYDNDGDIDLLVVRRKTYTALYRNTLASSNGWLEVDLVGAGGSLNTVGARAWVQTSDRVQMREVVAGSSFKCQEPPRLHFGLGPIAAGPTLPGGSQRVGGHLRGAAVVEGGAAGASSGEFGLGGLAAVPGPDWLVIRWFDGSYQIVKSPGAGQILSVHHAAVDDAGDLNADGHLTAADETLLQAAIADPVAYHAAHPKSPGLIVGDIDGNGTVDAADDALWFALPPH